MQFLCPINLNKLSIRLAALKTKQEINPPASTAVKLRFAPLNPRLLKGPTEGEQRGAANGLPG